VQNLYALTAVKDPLWGPLDVAVTQRELPQAVLRAAAPSDVLRGCLTALLHPDRPTPRLRNPVLYALTAAGIARRDRHLPVFLAYRAILLGYAQADVARMMPGERGPYSARLTACLALAHRAAAQQGDVGDTHLVESIAESLGVFDAAQRGAGISDRKAERTITTEMRTVRQEDLPHRSSADLRAAFADLLPARRGRRASRRRKTDPQLALW
jgi:hypothetical protein